MEARLTTTYPGARRGLAVLALGAIVLVTVAWWSLALVPAGSAAPEWLLRTRAVCFGITPTGLPHAGGWILLIGEPLGMVGALVVIWGPELRRDLQWLARTIPGRVVIVGSLVVVLGGAHLAGVRIRSALAMERVPLRGIPAWQLAEAQRGAAMQLALTDQHGDAFSLHSLRGTPVVVTFAYAHCETVCPTIVREVRAARTRSGREEIPLLVVTVDPWRDVPERLAHAAAAWELSPSDRVLGGPVAEVVAALETWGVAITRDPRTGEVSHPGTVIVVDKAGRLAARLDGDLSQLTAILQGT